VLAKEILGATLLTIHNLNTLLKLMYDIRQSIMDGQFDHFSTNFFDHWDKTE
jgi:tRNA-guanine family transglycosylase